MIHIACNIDHRYVRYCAVTLASVFSHHPRNGVTAHIVARELTDNDRISLQTVAGQWGGKLRFYTPDVHMLDGFTIRATHNRISLATYYRCFLSEMLPTDIGRVLYLDCDLLVLNRLDDLWNTPLNGAWVGAADDTGYCESERYTRLGYPERDSYFNAGVLLIDLEAWCKNDMSRLCYDYYNTHYDTIVFNDQDVLNGVLHDKRKAIDVKWNVQDGFFRCKNSLPPGWQEAHASALHDPAILHFTNRKPWEYDSQHPLRQLYFKYLDLTPWRGERPWHNPINIIKRTLRLLPFRLGIRKPRYIQP